MRKKSVNLRRLSTPFKEITNTNADNQGTPRNWYGRLSAQKKEEHLKKLRIAREQKKNADVNFGSK
jgi:hypothetical protein